MDPKYDQIIDHLLEATRHAHVEKRQAEAKHHLNEATKKADDYARSMVTKEGAKAAAEFRSEFKVHADRVMHLMDRHKNTNMKKGEGCSHDMLKGGDLCKCCGYLQKSQGIVDDVGADLVKSLARFADATTRTELLAKAAEFKRRVAALKKAKIYSFDSGKVLADLPSTETPRAAQGGVHNAKETGLTGQIVPNTVEGMRRASRGTEPAGKKGRKIQPPSSHRSIALQQVLDYHGHDEIESWSENDHPKGHIGATWMKIKSAVDAGKKPDQAHIDAVASHHAHDEISHWESSDKPKNHIAHAWATLSNSKLAKAKIFDINTKELLYDHAKQGVANNGPLKTPEKQFTPPATQTHDPGTLKEGDVFKQTSRHGVTHGRVVHVKEGHAPGEADFYYHRSDEHGNLKHHPADSAGNAIWHSNMFLGEKVEHVGHKPVEQKTIEHKGKTYRYSKIGHEGVDSYMSQLDDRHHMFHDHAHPDAHATFAQQEDRNAHTANGKLVSDFADHVAAGKDPKKFGRQAKKLKKGMTYADLAKDEAGLLPMDSMQLAMSEENPDEKEDAELGEKVENLVEEHMQDNAEAEKEEGHELFQKGMKPGMSFRDLEKAKVDDGKEARQKREERFDRNKPLRHGGLRERLMSGVHMPAFGSHEPGTSNMGAHQNDSARKEHSRRRLAEQRAMPAPKLPGEVEKAEMASPKPKVEAPKPHPTAVPAKSGVSGSPVTSKQHSAPKAADPNPSKR